MEELSQSQIVLLTLLVSFVTSMATGIVTVSLMSQAPLSVTETVNRVIEKTIREVASPIVSTPATPEVKTVVVHDSDQIASAIERASASVVRLYSSDGTQFLGIGTIVHTPGTIVTDVAAIGEMTDVVCAFGNGSRAHATVLSRDTVHGIGYLTIATSSLATTSPKIIPIVLGAHVQLGQSVVVIGGKSNASVSGGIVSSLRPEVPASTPLVETTIMGDNVIYGSPLIDSAGNLIGISTSISRASNSSSFIPTSVLK